MATNLISGRGFAHTLSALALLSLAACGTSGKGSFLAGTNGTSGTEGAASTVSDSSTSNKMVDDTTALNKTNGGGSTVDQPPKTPVSDKPVIVIPPGPVPPVPPPRVGPDGTLTRVTDLVTEITGGVLYKAGNATLVAPELLTPVTNLPVVGSLVDQTLTGASNLLTTTGAKLQNNGLAGVPIAGATLAQVATTADTLLNGAATVQVAGATLIGSSVPGAVTNLGVSVLSPTQTVGQAASVGLLNNAQSLTVALGAPASGATLGTVNAPADTLLGVQLASNPVASTGTQALIGLNAGGGTVQGSLATVGVLSNGQAASVSVAGLGLGSGLTPSIPVMGAPAASPAASGIVAAVTAPVAAVSTVASNTVTALTGGLLGGLGH